MFVFVFYDVLKNIFFTTRKSALGLDETLLVETQFAIDQIGRGAIRERKFGRVNSLFRCQLFVTSL